MTERTLDQAHGANGGRPPLTEIPLTENARIVLEKRYLRRGEDGKPIETIPEMFWRVASHIAAPDAEYGKDAYATSEAFYELLTSLRFFPNSPTFTGAGTPLGQLAACFTADMRVTTEQGVKRIADLQIGDRVLTHLGRYRPVTELHQRAYSGTLLRLKIKLIGTTLEVTPEHPIMTPAGWVRASELRVGDKVAVGIPQGVRLIPHFDLAESVYADELEMQVAEATVRVRRPSAYQNSGRQATWVNRFIELTPDLARLCGYYVAEGTLGPDEQYVRFTLGRHEVAYQDDISRLVEQIFNVAPNRSHSNRGSWTNINVYSRAVASWFRNHFGHHSYGKRIPTWLQYAPMEIQRAFLVGLMRGDGLYWETVYKAPDRKSPHIMRALRVTLSNPGLVQQVWQMCLRLGYDAAIRPVDTTYVTENAQASAQISLPPLQSRDLVREAFGVDLPEPDMRYIRNSVTRQGDVVYFEVQSIEAEDYAGIVYNCEVDEDHSYVTEGIVVHNCFVLPISDDLGRASDGIFQTLRDAALIQQTGGGNGFSFSRLRPKGDIVRTSAGRATGPVGFLRVYDKAFGEVAQGGTRRGANMAVLRVDHPDIEEFIGCKEDENQITNFNISVAITDAFMRAVENDEPFDLINPRDGKVWKTVRARDLFDKIIKHAHHNGEPGALFIDTANRSNPLPHLYQLEATNPCVTGDTLVATPSGWRRADQIREGDEICTVLGTGRVAAVEVNEAVPVFDVYLSDGAVVRVTASHQFHARDSRTKFFEARRVDELKPGDWIRVYRSVVPNNPVPPTSADLTDREYGFLVGVLVGDGCYTPHALSKNVVRLSTHADDVEWNDLLQRAFAKVGVEKMYTYVNAGSHSMMMDPKPGRVIADWVRSLPLEPCRGPEKRLPEVYINSNREFLIGLLDGLFSTDGSVDLQSNHPLLRFHTSSLELARQVRRILLMFGVYARISTSQRKRHDLNGRVIRHDRPKYDVTISGESLGRFFEQIPLSHPGKRMRLEEAALKANLTGGNWAAKVVKIEPAGVATVYDIYEPKSDTWITEGFVSRGCGEQWLGPYENCCLGSINLAKHVTPEGKVDWEKLRETIVLSTHFLDNVVSANKYVPAVPQLKEAALRARRIGLGIMALGDLMYHMGIRYGSEEAQEFAAQVMEFVRYHAMKTSIELAKERGPFPAIKGSIYDPENLKWTPPKPLKPYTHDFGRPPVNWDEIVEGIKQYGIRNAAQTTIAPTGCLVPGTLVATDQGLLPIELLGDPRGERWQEINLAVASEGGVRPATQFYVNGRAHTLRVITRRGYTLQGTEGHRIRVWQKGAWVWRRMDELRPGMIVPLQATGLIGQPRRVRLDTTLVTNLHASPITLPDEVTPDLAYLVGFFMGDGSLKERSLRFSLSDPTLRDRLTTLLKRVFDCTPIVSKDDRSSGLESLEVHSLNLVAFWRRNGFAKEPADPEHKGKGYRPHIPLAILRTNNRQVYAAFLAGLFDADASLHRGYLLTWTTTDQTFHDQVKVLLLTLGILTTSDRQITGWGQSTIYRLRVAHAEAALRLAKELSYLCRVIPTNGHVRRHTLADTVPLTTDQAHQLLSLAGNERERWNVWAWQQRQRISRESLRTFVTAHRAEMLAPDLRELVEAVESPIFYDEIQAVEDGGWQETYDLSVPATHAYVANGFISHNTIATVAGCEAYGCEPVFALAYIRHVNDNGRDLELRYTSPLFEQALIKAGLDEETRRRIVDEVIRKGTCQHITELPEHIRHTFVVSQDITAEEHVYMQAALQAFVDNSISKTINFPATATEKDVADAYFLAWKLGCKGLTVYVTGSREKVVLETLETKEKKEKEAAVPPPAAAPTAPAAPAPPPAEQPAQPLPVIMKPRPRWLPGRTYRVPTPLGTAFITINENGGGQPFEVFMNVGKAGSDTAAVAEAMGRLISLVLRLPSPMSAMTRLRQVIDQLSGIGGGRPMGFGAQRVRSLPDGVAQALADYLGDKEGEGEVVPAAVPEAPQPVQLAFEIGDLCPECGQATLVSEEGCRRCYTCGFTEC